MKSIGFDLEKGAIRFCCLGGTFQNPSLLHKERIPINPKTPLPEYMDRFETTFDELILKHKPDRIGYRLSTIKLKEQIYNLAFPYAILNLIAKKRIIDIYEFVKPNFKPLKFGLAKSLDMYAHCDQEFRYNPPYWDVAQKNAILSAWLAMKD